MTVFYLFEPVFHSYEPSFLDVESVDVSRLTEWLGEDEIQVFQALRFPKRRREWLAGRLALKRLVQSADLHLSKLTLPKIQIVKAPSGAPQLLIDGGLTKAGTISLSHSNGMVFCAYQIDENAQLGVDLELVEARDPSFLWDYFTNDEIAQIQTHPLETDFAATLFWSAKEALLKALRFGLRVDPLKIELSVPDKSHSQSGWLPLTFTSHLEKLPALHLYWRKERSFVLTICCQAANSEQFRQLSAN